MHIFLSRVPYTQFIVTPRPQAADQIVVMRNGQVAEVGTHDELVARPGSHYNELMSVQNLTMAST